MTQRMYQPYSQLPEIFEGDRLEILFYCINFAVNWGRYPLDDYIKGILGDAGPVGGDPGWDLIWIKNRDDADFPEQWDACVATSNKTEGGCYQAFAVADISGIESETAYYPVEEVRHYIRIALDNIAMHHSERAKEVGDVIMRYGLFDSRLP